VYLANRIFIFPEIRCFKVSAFDFLKPNAAIGFLTYRKTKEFSIFRFYAFSEISDFDPSLR